MGYIVSIIFNSNCKIITWPNPVFFRQTWMPCIVDSKEHGISHYSILRFHVSTEPNNCFTRFVFIKHLFPPLFILLNISCAAFARHHLSPVFAYGVTFTRTYVRIIFLYHLHAFVIKQLDIIRGIFFLIKFYPKPIKPHFYGSPVF